MAPPRALAVLGAAAAWQLRAAAAGGAGPIPIAGGRFALSWVEDIPVPVHPGYAEFSDELPGQLVVTSFEATPFIGRSSVYLYRVSGCSGDECLQALPGSEAIDWPNAGTGLNASVFGFPALAVGSGFLVPSHTEGGVWVLEADANPQHLTRPVKITDDRPENLPDDGWFYHLAVPRDMDGDGRIDFVTARAQYGVWPWSAKQGQLVWLQQPATDALSGAPWARHLLTDGPDFLFCVQPGARTLALAAAEYINQRVVYYYLDGAELKSRVLDEASGPGFSCSWADLNGDGRLDLLATNHVNQNGSVFAYAFDGDDFTTANVSRQILATGFSSSSTRQGTAAPGDAAAFQPSKVGQGKPYIFLSGDNGNDIYVLVPRSEDAGDWQYTAQKLADLGADVGRPAIGDVTGDGFADVYVPAYDRNLLVHYKFEAAASEVLV